MVKGPGSKEQTNFLGGCLVESDSEFEKRARKIKRRALVASVVLQILVVAALILFPLLSKGESIAAYNVTPSVPYRHGANPERRPTQPRPHGPRPNPCHFCAPTSIPPTIVTHDLTPPDQPVGDNQNFIPGTPGGSNIPGSPDGLAPPRGPEDPRKIEHVKPPTLKVSAGVQAARLIHRVEPAYPTLPKQLRREGRVELRALIGTDGHIKSLEVVSGDPLFIQASLSAVQEWRYQPTLLNNEPVEVETYITVNYTLSH